MTSGLAIFDKLHSKANDVEVVMFAFDVLELNGEDCRGSPLVERKARLRKLLARARHGIYYTDHLDADGSSTNMHASSAARASSPSAPTSGTSPGAARLG